MNEKTVVQIILAQPRGFCAGVKRAIDIVEVTLDKYGNERKVCVLHEIVHNVHVINYFLQKGVIFVDKIADVPDGAILIFSAHGVSDTIENEAKARNLHVIDATCPLVTKVHKEAQKHELQGLQIILIGHSGHPEVEGTSGRVQQPVILLQSKKEVENLEVIDPDKLAYVTQTTLSVDETSEIISALKRRFPKIIGPDLRDICYATQNRQIAVRALAEKTEVVLVIGSENSSNSNRLKDICAAKGIPAYLIDNYRDVQMSWLLGMNRIGITAGASAPDLLVEELVQYLQKELHANVTSLDGIVERVVFNLPKELLSAQKSGTS